MDWIRAVVLSAVLAVSWCADLSFPPEFRFGAATAAYQVEGAWNEGGKSESIWDRYVHEDPRRISDFSNGDVACDSYHQWKKDIELAEELGLHFYRFSISWPRILPSGFPNHINEDGKNYYNNLIDGLLEKGIEPLVTMYHWDLPQSLQDLGGWTNPLIVDWFVDYARVLYTLFGDRVKIWLTLNEPVIICDGVYNSRLFAPALYSPEVGTYLCNKYVLLAHAKAWRLYDEEFKPKYHGKVSIANQIPWIDPKTKEDEDLAELARENCAGRYAHAIYSKEGGWPPSIEKHMKELSLKRGYPKSTFPAFTQEEIETIRGTYDFFALNHYTSRVIRQAKEGEKFLPWPLGDAVDLNAKLEKQEGWGKTASSWFFVNPVGIRKQLVWMKERYGDMEIMITENGLSTFGGLDDQNRIQYYRDYLEQILLAIKEDGINVTAYSAWTLIDNFEWMDGYSAVLSVSWCADLSFPPGFRFGASTAAYQVEGAWNEGGRSESTWDRVVHEDPRRISDLSNGDVACDSYHQWKKDIELAEELGLHLYRFSISWTRILPSGFPNHINEDGKNYYNNLIDGLLEKGIEPLVTMYHWDLPQSLQDLGGWTNPLIVDWFVDYARVLFNLFGDRVKIWLTLNEPVVICDAVYNSRLFAPALYSPEVGAYLCNKYVLLAHAKAWRLYDEEFKPKYHGKVSIANQILWFDPKTKEDEDIAELARENCAGRYAHAIYSKEGGWPPSIEKHMKELSLKRGYPKSTFPAFTQEEIETIRGTYDFFALNHYTSRVIRQAKEGEMFTPWPLGDAVDLNGKVEKREGWANTASSWFFVNPVGIRKQLVWMKEKYGDMEIMITENGLSTFGGLDDQNRIQYYRDYLEQILLAIKEDGINVTAYSAWTLIDNFEWMDGYTVKFGLYEVDFSDPSRKRTARASAHYYASIIKTHSLDVPTTRNEL